MVISSCLKKWIVEHFPEIESWVLLQEEHVHSFLLTLPNRHREIVKKDLNVLFKLGKKKRMITHIPIMDTPTREYPSNMEPLTLEEQKAVAKVIRNNIYDEPLSCLLTSFCFYYGSHQRKSVLLKSII